MHVSRTRRVAVITASCAAALSLTACGGESSKENFAADLKAMGHRLVGDITSDKETVSTSILGLAPMAFELPMTTPQSNSGSGTSSTAPRNNQTPSPANTSGTGSKPTPTPSTKTIVILEATVKVGKCEVQLERLEKENDTLFKKVKGRDIEIFVVDEIRVNGDWQDLDNGPDSPTVASLRSFLQQSAASCYKP